MQVLRKGEWSAITKVKVLSPEICPIAMGQRFHCSEASSAACDTLSIMLVQLPAYSPELNPVENLWHYFSSHDWANRAYVDYDDLRCATVDAW